MLYATQRDRIWAISARGGAKNIVRNQIIKEERRDRQAGIQREGGGSGISTAEFAWM